THFIDLTSSRTSHSPFSIISLFTSPPPPAIYTLSLHDALPIFHPAQLKTVNDIYAPTSTEIQEAQKIVDAYDSSFDEGRGALVVDGKMIDAPVAERAKKLLEM